MLAQVGGIPTLDMTSIICDEQVCHLELDGTLVYAQTHHLTDAFALRQAPRLDALVSSVMG